MSSIADSDIYNSMLSLVLRNKTKLLNIEDNDSYHAALYEVQSALNDMSPQQAICNELQPVIVDLLGQESIGLSSTVYLRGVRPVRDSNLLVESLPMHREIFYSDHDYANYQINLHIPLLNYTTKTAMQFYPYSHLVPDSKIQVEKLTSEESGVRRFSKGHSLGLPYNPKIIRNLTVLGEPQKAPVGPGEAFIFDSKLIHGSGSNNSSDIRFSIDFAILPFSKISEQKAHHHASYKNGSHFYEYRLV